MQTKAIEEVLTGGTHSSVRVSKGCFNYSPAYESCKAQTKNNP